MIDSKLLITLISMIVAVFAVYNSSIGNSVSENFWGGPGFTTVGVPQVHDKKTGKTHDVHPHQVTSDHFVSYPSFQANLEPRFSNINYGANINYKLPSHKNLAVPSTPLSSHDMDIANIKENYSGCSSCENCTGSCGTFKNGTPLDETYVTKTKFIGNKNSPDANNDLPKPDVLKGIEQYYSGDRLIYSNKRPKQQQHGCPIRGDLAIVKDSRSWFQSSYGPSDLRTGAMQVMGGVDNGTANELAELKFKHSGGVDTISGGVNLANSIGTTLGGDSTTIIATSFP